MLTDKRHVGLSAHRTGCTGKESSAACRLKRTDFWLFCVICATSFLFSSFFVVITFTVTQHCPHTDWSRDRSGRFSEEQSKDKTLACCYWLCTLLNYLYLGVYSAAQSPLTFNYSKPPPPEKYVDCEMVDL